MKRLIVLSAAFLLAVAFVVPRVGFAQTADIQSQINALLAEVQQLQAQLAAQGGSTTVPAFCYTFTSNLSIGQSGAAVTALQTALQKDGESVSVTGTFDDQTASAVTGFQEKYATQILAPYGLSNGTGYVGSATRAELNALYGCGTTTTAPVTVTSPSAGQSFVQGSTMNIQWTPASGGVADIQLVSTSGGESTMIYSNIVYGDSINYNGYYSYTIPTELVGSYYVRLMNPENDQAGAGNPPGTVIGQSGVFTVTAPSTGTPVPTITVSGISSGMTVSAGQPINFTYSMVPASEYDVTYILVPEGNTPTTVSNGAFYDPSWGGYGIGGFQPNYSVGTFSPTITIPSGIPAGSYHLALYVLPSAGYPKSSALATAISNSFTLTSSSVAPTPTITVTSPTAGTTVTQGNNNNLTATWTGGTPTVNINLFQNGQLLTSIAGGDPNTGQFTWSFETPNSESGSGYQIQIASVGVSPGYSGLSGSFNVAPASGQGLSFVSVSLDPTNPAAGSAVVGSTLPVLAFDVSAPSGEGAVSIRSVTVNYVTNGAYPQFSGLTLWNGNTQIAGPVSFVDTSPYTATFYLSSPLVISGGSTSALTIKANAVAYQSTPSVIGTNGTFSIPAGGITASGQGSTLPTVQNGSAMGNPMTIVALVNSILPTISSISPNQGTANTSVTVYGTNFTADGHQAVQFYASNGTLAGTVNFIDMSYISSQSMTFSPYGLNMAPGTYQVEVVTAAGTSNGQSFTLTAPTPAQVTVTSPVAGQTFTPGSVMTVQWTPISPAITEIDLVPTDGSYPTHGHWLYQGNCGTSCYPGTSLSYGFGSPLPSNIPPGSYYIAFYSSGTLIGQSGTFMVTAPQLSVPTVSIAPTSMAFSLLSGSNSPSPASSYTTFTVSPNQSVNWTALPSANWIIVSPSGSAQTNGTASISINAQAAASLSPGTHTATVTFSPASGSTSFTPQMVSVILTVTSAPVAANPYDVNGDGVVNLLDYQTEQAAVLGSNTTCGLKCDLNGDGQVNVVDLQKMTNYLLSIGISPTESASPSSLAFTVSAGSISSPSPSSASFAINNYLPNAGITVANAYTSPLPSGANWLSVGAMNGSGVTSVSVQPGNAPGGLAAGTYTASITVSAYGQTVTVPVTLTVTPVIAPAANIYDVNGDGVVNMLDYQVELAAALGTNTTCGLKCDLNGDGQVNVVDLQKMTNYLLSIGINPNATTSTTQPAATLSINGSTGGQSFAAGQPWTLSLSSTGVPSTPFSLCYQNTPPGGSAGSVSCTSAGFGTTDGNGNWSLSGAFATSTVGSDAEWVTFPSANLSSNHITFTVTNPGVSAATDNQSQLATVFLSLAGLIHSLSNVLK